MSATAAPRTVIGIDPGTACGWCVRYLAPACQRADGSGSAQIDCESGVWDLRPRRHEGGGMRYVRLRRLLRELLDTHEPALVAIEEVRRHLGTDAAHIYGGILAVVQEECEARGIPYLGIPVGTIKKRATGRGNATKAAVLEATRSTWPGFDGTYDEADARWIAVCGADELQEA